MKMTIQHRVASMWRFVFTIRGSSVVFMLTYVSYMCYHMTRASFSAVKALFLEDTGIQKVAMGWIDFSFLVAYALGQYVFGLCGDVFDRKKVLVIGMLLTSIWMFLMGALGLSGVSAAPAYGCVRVIDGFTQASGWTATVAIMGAWFPVQNRGTILGVWASCSNTGDIVGLHIAGAMIAGSSPSSWKMTLFVVGAIVVVMACVNALLLRSRPKIKEETLLLPSYPSTSDDNLFKTGALDAMTPSSPTLVHTSTTTLTTSEKKMDHVTNEVSAPFSLSSISSQPSHEHSIRVLSPRASFFRAWRVPGVAVYSASYAFLKCVNYSLFFWLPFYLKEGVELDASVSAHISTLFDWGFLLGGVVTGLSTDLLGRREDGTPIRSPALVVSLLLATIPLVWLRVATTEVSISMAMFLAGILLGGPAESATSAISVDLGTHSSLKDNEVALSTVVGIIDGTGALGAAIGQLLVRILSDTYGWPSVFIWLCVATCLSATLLLPLAIDDTRAVLAGRRHRRNNAENTNHHASLNQSLELQPAPTATDVEAGGALCV